MVVIYMLATQSALKERWGRSILEITDRLRISLISEGSRQHILVFNDQPNMELVQHDKDKSYPDARKSFGSCQTVNLRILIPSCLPSSENCLEIPDSSKITVRAGGWF